MSFIRQDVLEHLKANPHIAEPGHSPELLDTFDDISPRTARRFCQNFRDMQDEEDVREDMSYTYHPKSRPFLVAVFDIETTDFLATGEQGIFVGGCILPLTASKPLSFSVEYEEIRDSENMPDRPALKRFLTELNKYDLLIGHYIGDGGTRGFDLRWLETRAALLQLPPMRTFMVYDTYYEAKRLGHAGRKSLAFLIDFFNLEGTKTNIYPRAWHDIRSANQRKFDIARRNIMHHCELDVLANREVYHCLYPRSITRRGNFLLATLWRGGIPNDED